MMNKHLYKAVEWECCSKWHVNDTSNLCGNAGLWWIPCKILNITPVEYAKMLIEKFDAIDVHYNQILTFAFDTQAAARKYKNYINKMARQTKFIIE